MTISIATWWKIPGQYEKEQLNLSDRGRLMHLYMHASVYQAIIASDNGLVPVRHQAILWISVGLLSIGPLGTTFNEIVIKIQLVSLKKMNLKTSSAKCRPLCLELSVYNVSDNIPRLYTLHMFVLIQSDLVTHIGVKKLGHLSLIRFSVKQ